MPSQIKWRVVALRELCLVTMCSSQLCTTPAAVLVQHQAFRPSVHLLLPQFSPARSRVQAADSSHFCAPVGSSGDLYHLGAAWLCERAAAWYPPGPTRPCSVCRVLRLWVFVMQTAATLLKRRRCSAAVPASHGTAQFSRHAMTTPHGTHIYIVVSERACMAQCERRA